DQILRSRCPSQPIQGEHDREKNNKNQAGEMHRFRSNTKLAKIYLCCLTAFRNCVNVDGNAGTNDSPWKAS
ncbi:MAG: hypothetical protein ACI814_004060, partial [Mariniblastus sp.]